ncbi:MAG: DNA-3-methyladenine glycosylase family protein [Hyphomicrobiaceae bacterium]
MARPVTRLIASDDDVAAGVRALRRKCTVMRRIHETTGHPPLRRREPGFEGLARIIVGQQLSIASAAAIWGRLAAAYPGLPAAAITGADDADLRALGLSRPKIRTLRAAAEAVSAGLDLQDLGSAGEVEIHDRLTAINGIGPWTADIFIMFCLGRADGFAAGDLALQIAAQHAYDLSERPSPAELLALADRWRPWRGVAARLLWAYYPTIRKVRTAEPV